MTTSHNLALALDEYLRLTDPDHEFRRQVEAYLGIPVQPDLPPAFSTLARLRWEAEQEVERLIALMDAIDADPDLEPEDEADPLDDPLNGFEPNFATTEQEDASSSYARPPITYVVGLDDPPDELEEACEDEGAQCEDEGDDSDTEAVNEDGDILDQGEGGDDGPYSSDRARRHKALLERKLAPRDLPILRYAGGNWPSPQT